MDGIFLHTGWRTAGTWLWSRLRNDPAFMAFYEPLHEMLPTMTEAQMREIGAGSWNSRHPRMAPYFIEYLPFLQPGGGVAGAKAEFGFDDVFLDANAANDDLRDYIKGLCIAARAEGRMPVLKFTRSLGRLPWFRRHFPDCAHVLVARNPWTQFRSAWRCLAEDGNAYFLAAPLVVLERNAADPDAAALIASLDLPVTAGAGAGTIAHIVQRMGTVRDMKAGVLYRASFALWLLSMHRALPAASCVIDGDAAAAMAAAFFAGTGICLAAGAAAGEPAERPDFSRPGADITALDVRDAHLRGLGRLAARIDPDTAARLRVSVLAAERMAAADLAPPVRQPQGAELLRGHLPGIKFSY